MAAIEEANNILNILFFFFRADAAAPYDPYDDDPYDDDPYPPYPLERLDDPPAPYPPERLDVPAPYPPLRLDVPPMVDRAVPIAPAPPRVLPVAVL
eukprot:CAMPEP_0196244976 /NCGR_PEP_ID=MMETSP0913-20130531/32010_1 /TAXON_ID=49265 /ORGANISM="Thalassiosira rotula, Strain GSO102" /LENGTH=95 /DNA_ID=CAMNT_0041529081 /DNA_START=163 /DNA_END=446 /DNA_ORIENTATION=+